jgi:hypothetical protein
MEVADIKKVYLPSRVSALAGQPVLGSGTFTIQHPGKAGQESEAEKGIAKVMLLCLCGDADFDTGVVTNAAFAQPAAAAGMQLILNCPRVVRALVLSDLMHQNFMLAKDHDPTHIMSWELPMTNQ